MLNFLLAADCSQQQCMIRSFKGVRPAIPSTCFVDESAQIIGDVVLGEHASIWMKPSSAATSTRSASAPTPTFRTTASSTA